MKVVLYTVPGTGTRFMANILESVYGYRAVGYEEFKTSNHDAAVFIRLHTDPLDSQHQLINRISGRFVTTLRDPVLAYLSRVRTMVSKTQAWTVPDSACRWARLMEEVGKRRMFYFPVDPMQINGDLMDCLSESIRPKRVNRGALGEVLGTCEPIGASSAGSEKIEYLKTGKIKGVDLAPLDPAKAWVECILGGSVTGSHPASREAL